MISFESIVRLGWGYARVLARKLRPERDQLRRFVAQYQADGIVPFAAHDMTVLEQSSRCTACGACDTLALIDGGHDALGRRGPMAFVLGVSRHSGEHDAAEIVKPIDAARLDRWTAACPVRVPFRELAELVDRRATALQRVRRSPRDAS